MTRMDCGAAGGAISVWVNVVDCPGNGGIISSYNNNRASLISCYNSNIQYNTLLGPIFLHKIDK